MTPYDELPTFLRGVLADLGAQKWQSLPDGSRGRAISATEPLSPWDLDDLAGWGVENTEDDEGNLYIHQREEWRR